MQRSDGTSAVRRFMAMTVEQGTIVGADLLIAQRGRVRRSLQVGWADREAGLVMHPGFRFRIASMTKAIVSVAALALCDRGLLTLEDPITAWLPWFRPALSDGTQPDITLGQLLTHSAGLGYCFTEPPNGDFHRLGISDGLDGSNCSLAENLAKVARAPLAFQPGSAWGYSIATDVLGGLLEAATGQSLPALVHELVTGPLEMRDSSFHAGRDDRLATPYAAHGDQIMRMSEPHILPFAGSSICYSPARAFDLQAWPSAGTGMISTAEDYLRFAEMIRCGGAPILRPETAALFSQNAIGSAMAESLPGHGFGLGVSILLDPPAASVAGNAGSWGWGGVYGTHFFVDPAAELSVICLTNTALTGMAGDFPAGLRHAIYRDL